VPARDAGALADALGTYLSSARVSGEAGAFNRTRAQSDFSWRASALRLLEIYQRVIASRKAA
jgi:glycosyltransferase involved in cell wall biosynthesis